MFRKKGFWIVFIVVLLAASGGYVYYDQMVQTQDAPADSTVKTAKVRRGDLLVTASGAGTLAPASEVALGFRSGGVLVDVAVQVGDDVLAGDVLARLDDTDARKALAAAQLQVAQAEANLNARQDPGALEQAIVQAQLQVAQAEANLAAAQLKLDELLNWEPDAQAIALAEANLDAAQADYAEVLNRAAHSDDVLTAVRVNLEQAQANLEAAQVAYDVAWDSARDWELSDPKRATALENERASTLRNLDKAQADLEIAQANYNLATIGVNNSDQLNAWLKVLSSQAALENAQVAPEAADVEAARSQVQQAELALTQAQLNLRAIQNPDLTALELALAQAQLNLEAAQRALEQTTLVAPVGGMVVAVSAQPGEAVGTSALITLADLGHPLVEIYMDETDMDKVVVGNEVQVIFDALPEETFVGHIARVAPMLVMVDGVPAVQAVAALDPEALVDRPSLPGGLNAAVDVVAGRAEDALLVPVEALRELAPGEYAVFVMQDGEPKLRVVEVGLRDFAYAEILSGLEAGDIVSTGIVETE